MADVHPRFTGSPARLARGGRPFSVLVDGMDLTGKSTLSRLLVRVLEEAGLRVVHHRGCLALRHPLRRRLARTEPGNRPSSRSLNASFLASGLMDRVLPGVLGAGRPVDVVVQESYVDRAVAYGVAAGPWPAPLWACRHPAVFPAFDLAVLTRADHTLRRRRFQQREHTDAVDTVSVADVAFETRFYGALERVARRHRRLERVDTGAEPAEAAARRLTAAVLRSAGDPAQRAPLPSRPQAA